MRDVRIASRVLRKAGLPVNLIAFVTSRCNLLCRHCFYWEELNGNKKELGLEEFVRISRSLPNLLSVSLTGGEPYLRADLPEIAEAFEQNSGVRNLQIPSNGFLVERTLERVEQLLQKVRRARVCTGVSLDGPEEIHNQVRQNPKSFARAVETLSHLRRLKPSFPNLSVGVALTVSAANYLHLDDFLTFVEDSLQPDAITVTLARGKPLDPDLIRVPPQAYAAFTARILEHRRRHRLTDSWIDRMVIAKEAATYRLVQIAATSEKRIAPCYAGDLIGILSETGEVRLCETLDRSMGNVRDFDCDFAALWKSPQAAAARRYQKELGCQCTYECAMSVNTLFRPSSLVRIVRDSLRQ